MTTNINEIIIHYLDGSASKEEKDFLLQWLKQSDKNRTDFMTTRDLWLSCHVAMGNDIEVNIAFDRLKDRILRETQQINKVIKLKKKLYAWRWAGIAAALFLLVGISYKIGYQHADSKQQVFVQKQLITAKGSKGQFTLPDGSIVWLNSESKLAYPESFSDNERRVQLEGEAYFEVQEDKSKPFIVEAGKIDVEVLGTHFNIDSYDSNKAIYTALLEGSVKISGKDFNNPIYLRPNELLCYQKADKIISIEKTKVNLYIDWIKDRLIFDNACLSDIIISMQGRYNMDIECPKSFASATYLSFTIRQESIEEVLNAISLIIPIKYKIEENKAYIIPK